MDFETRHWPLVRVGESWLFCARFSSSAVRTIARSSSSNISTPYGRAILICSSSGLEGNHPWLPRAHGGEGHTPTQKLLRQLQKDRMSWCCALLSGKRQRSNELQPSLSMGMSYSALFNDIVSASYYKYLQCANCHKITWLDSPTPLEDIPDKLLIDMIKKKSLRETDGKIPCGSTSCSGLRNGQSRRSNKNCVHDPPLCSQCCRDLGVRCPAHGGNQASGSDQQVRITAC